MTERGGDHRAGDDNKAGDNDRAAGQRGREKTTIKHGRDNRGGRK